MAKTPYLHLINDFFNIQLPWKKKLFSICSLYQTLKRKTDILKQAIHRCNHSLIDLSLDLDIIILHLAFHFIFFKLFKILRHVLCTKYILVIAMELFHNSVTVIYFMISYDNFGILSLCVYFFNLCSDSFKEIAQGIFITKRYHVRYVLTRCISTIS